MKMRWLEVDCASSCRRHNVVLRLAVCRVHVTLKFGRSRNARVNSQPCCCYNFARYIFYVPQEGVSPPGTPPGTYFRPKPTRATIHITSHTTRCCCEEAIIMVRVTAEHIFFFCACILHDENSSACTISPLVRPASHHTREFANSRRRLFKGKHAHSRPVPERLLISAHASLCA